ncbi:MAG: ClbS/DfsB family four-helix bundle protein [Ktedonobacteraceae bacterium]|nr:ClbS/DfsB family four-helix bundle protein [Ktedonobacteraceae bacterium]
MDKTALLNTIQTEYTRFESIIAPLNEMQLCTPYFEGEWSIKDIMAHIATWEQICTRWLEKVIYGGTPEPSERLDPESNDQIYRENQNRSLTDVQEFFHYAHQQFLHQVNLLVQTLSEEDLNTPHRFAWTDAWPGSSLTAVIADNSYEHYHDHAQQIHRWLDIPKQDVHNPMS